MIVLNLIRLINQPKLCYSLKSEKKNYSSDSLFKRRGYYWKSNLKIKKIPGANIIVYDNGSSDDSLKNNKSIRLDLLKKQKEEKAMLCEECF